MGTANAVSASTMTTATILNGFIILLDNRQDEGDRTYRYTDRKTGRQFDVYRSLDMQSTFRFLLAEITPNGRVFERLQDKSIGKVWDEPKIAALELKVGPNQLLSACRKAKIDPDTMVFIGAGYSINSRYHDSLESCAAAIAEAIHTNGRYNAYRELSAEEKASHVHQQQVSTRDYWHAEAGRAKDAQESGAGIFKGSYTICGAVSEEHRTRILAYLNAPSEAVWNEIRGLHIAGHTTLWQAWCKCDDNAPRSGNKGFPDAEQLREAIRFAIAANLEHIDEKLNEVGPKGLNLC